MRDELSGSRINEIAVARGERHELFLFLAIFVCAITRQNKKQQKIPLFNNILFIPCMMKIFLSFLT